MVGCVENARPRPRDATETVVNETALCFFANCFAGCVVHVLAFCRMPTRVHTFKFCTFPRKRFVTRGRTRLFVVACSWWSSIIVDVGVEEFAFVY
jgi:hypothetical protein